MRYLVKTRPTRELDAWNKAFNRFFDDDFFRPLNMTPAWREGSPNSLALDMAETDDSLTVEASLPGFTAEDVDISIHDGVLTIKGEVKREEEQDEEGKYHLRERYYGSFHRAVRLPVEVNADAAEASFENGVLRLTLPKAEAVKPKKIAVKAS